MKKAFLEHAVVELVYKFNKKPTTSVGRGNSIAKVSFKLLGGGYIHIYIMDTNTDYITHARACTCTVINHPNINKKH